MLNNKYLKLKKLYQDTVKTICNDNGEFNSFFITSAFNHRYAFNNAVVTFAQERNAKTLLTFDQWAIYGRIPKKYSKGILLFDNNSNNQYSVVFDYVKTTVNKKIKTSKNIKFFEYQNTPDVVDAIKNMYRMNIDTTDLYEVLYHTVSRTVESTFTNATKKEQNLYTTLVTNMLFSRFSQEVPYKKLLPNGSVNEDELINIYNNTMEVFRAEYRALSNELPKYIVKAHQKEVDNLSTLEKDKADMDTLKETNSADDMTVVLIDDTKSNEATNYTTQKAKPSIIVTETELEEILSKGSNIVDSKFRIYEFFNEKHTSAEKINFLKNEYGIGGYSYTTSSAQSAFVDFNNKGIKISIFADNSYQLVTYNKLSSFISEKIDKNEYLSEKEARRYLLYYVTKTNNLADYSGVPSIKYSIGDTVIIASTNYIISNKNDDIVTVSNENASLFSNAYSVEEFEQILLSNIYQNRRLITVQPTEEKTVSEVTENEEALSVQRNPQVIIGFSEHPALYDFSKGNKHLSFSYANELLGSLDMLENSKRKNPQIGYYYKTDFKIIYSIDGKSVKDYCGRYDLADGETDLLNHIKDFYEWNKAEASTEKLEEFESFISNLEEALTENPLTDEQLQEINTIVNADYGLDETEDFEEQPIEEENQVEDTKTGIFYVNSESQTVDWIYYETDTYPDGLYVVNTFSFDDILNAKDVSATADEFFANIENISSRKLINVGSEESEAVEEKFHNRANFIDCTEGTKQALINLATPIKLEEKFEDITGKEIAYADTTFKVKSVSKNGAVSLEDISSSANGKLPVNTVLPYDKVFTLFEVQKEKPLNNFVITDNRIGEGTPTQRYKNNVNAIKVINALIDENRVATSDEQQILSQYVGWGGLSDCFKESSPNFTELKNLLSSDDYDSARASTLTSFYTPPIVIKAMYKALLNSGFTNGSILDPACGTGHFFGLIPEEMQKSRLYGVELDNITGRIAQQLYPNANIAIQGFEKTNIPNNYIDVVVGNVPFGNFQVFDPKYKKYSLQIHDYFFIKALDKLRPNGILAFVTSKGTLDKKNSSARKLMAERAELIGAIRLPNNTFKKAANTEVTADIIFMQKRAEPIKLNEYPDWVNVSKNTDGIEINNYFIHHPEMICGNMQMTTTQYDMDSVCIADEEKSLPVKLGEAISNLKFEYKPYAIELDSYDETEEIIEADVNARNYSYFYDNGKLYYRENGIMTLSKLSGIKEERIVAMIKLVDVTRKVIDAQVNNYPDEHIKKYRAELNNTYDDFVKHYGTVSSKANSVFKDDNSYPLLLSLENIVEDESNEKQVQKSDIFFKNTITPYVEITSAENNEDALIISVAERGIVDLEYMSSLTGNSVDDIISELEGRSIFLIPYEDRYVTADEYLSGNVKEKLNVAKNAALNDDRYNANVTALEKVQPEDIPSSGISVHLGTRWIPVKYYNDFLKEIFKKPRYTNIIIEFSEYNSTYYINHKNVDNYSTESQFTYGLKEKNGYHILEDCLNLRSSKVFDTITYSDGSKDSVLNKKLTIIAQNKQEILKAKFADWIFKDPNRRKELTKLYNDKFNCIVNRKYDGSHLTFAGMNPNITLREHQINAIARMLYGGNTLLAHQVGAGKTFEMIAGAMKLKELSLVHKSMIVVPKHLVAQTGAEFLRLYPAANILVAEEKDFTTKNRKRFCTRIATNDYDAIIIGHTQFDKIPLKAETQAEILQEQLDEIMDYLSSAKDDNLSKATVKSLETSRKTIEKKLLELKSLSKKDDVITFEELGVDQIFIDEAHLFKNLYIYTKMNNVSGVASGKGSGRASDLYSKVVYLNKQNSGHGVVFATGTPISNSMSEMYIMQKYLQADILQKNGLHIFDNWATTFGEAISSLELSPEGNSYQVKTRFAKFNNIPELMTMFREFADVQTSETLKLFVPDVEREIVEIPPTEMQKELIAQLGERADDIRQHRVSQDEDNMLLITSDGRKLALDTRIVAENSAGGHKVEICAENVYNIWKQTDNQTQIVFCDLSTPTGKKSGKKYNVYDDLKSQLESKGIPSEEIEFIQDYNTSAKKAKLYDRIRNSSVRVIIGSTTMLGTGANIQDNLVALHHLDCPYRPSDIEQREGRIIRQGNKNDKVKIFNYVTKGTFDAFMYQTVERKQKFISTIMTAKHITQRSADDIDEATLNYAQIKAVASDNPLVMKKFEVDTAINKLTLVRNNYIDEHRQMEDECTFSIPQKLLKAEAFAEKYKEDIECVKAHSLDDSFEMEIFGTVYTDRDKAYEAMIDCRKRIVGNNLLNIGTYKGFTMYIYNESIGEKTFLNMTIKNRLGYKVKLAVGVGVENISRIDTTLNSDISTMYKLELDNIKYLESKLKELSEECNRKFPQEDEYQELLRKQAEINSALSHYEKEAENVNKDLSSADKMRLLDKDADGRNDFIDSDGYSKQSDLYMRLTLDEFKRLSVADEKYNSQCRSDGQNGYILKYNASEKEYIENIIKSPTQAMKKV